MHVRNKQLTTVHGVNCNVSGKLVVHKKMFGSGLPGEETKLVGWIAELEFSATFLLPPSLLAWVTCSWITYLICACVFGAELQMGSHAGNCVACSRRRTLGLCSK